MSLVELFTLKWISFLTALVIAVVYAYWLAVYRFGPAKAYEDVMNALMYHKTDFGPIKYDHLVNNYHDRVLPVSLDHFIKIVEENLNLDSEKQKKIVSEYRDLIKSGVGLKNDPHGRIRRYIHINILEHILLIVVFVASFGIHLYL